jgi:hypothetical protein
LWRPAARPDFVANKAFNRKSALVYSTLVVKRSLMDIDISTVALLFAMLMLPALIVFTIITVVRMRRGKLRRHRLPKHRSRSHG